MDLLSSTMRTRFPLTFGIGNEPFGAPQPRNKKSDQPHGHDHITIIILPVPCRFEQGRTLLVLNFERHLIGADDAEAGGTVLRGEAYADRIAVVIDGYDFLGFAHICALRGQIDFSVAEFQFDAMT